MNGDTANRGRRWSVKVMARARTMAAAGWKPAEISRILAKEHGTAPHLDTIRRWTQPDSEARWEAHRRQQARRRWEARHARLKPQSASTEAYKEARARSLYAEAGLTPRMVARCMAFDFEDDSWTEDRVRSLLGLRAYYRRSRVA